MYFEPGEGPESGGAFAALHRDWHTLYDKVFEYKDDIWNSEGEFAIDEMLEMTLKPLYRGPSKPPGKRCDY